MIGYVKGVSKKMFLKWAVRKIGKLGSNGPFFDADHTDMVHFGLSGFYSGVLVHQSIAPQTWRTTEIGLVQQRTAPLIFFNSPYQN